MKKRFFLFSVLIRAESFIRRRLRRVMLILAFVRAFSLFAYNFDELLNAAFANNPEILKCEQEYLQSKLDQKDAQAGFFPTINLQMSGTYMLNPPLDAIYLNVDQIIDSVNWQNGVKPAKGNQYIKIYDGMENTLYRFELSLTQPIFTWGKITNAAKLYKQISQIKQTQLESKREELKAELESRLTALYYVDNILKILDEEKEYAARLVKVSEDAEKSGMLLKQDVLDAKIKAKQLDIVRQDLKEQIDRQLLELERSTGLENLSVENVEYFFDERSLAQILENDREEALEKSVSGDKLSIKLLTQLQEATKTAEKISKASVNWKPDFALQLSAGYGGSRLPLLEPNWLRKDDYSANISIGLKTVIWDGGKKARDVSRKISESKTAEINKLDVCATIKKTISEEWNAAEVCSMKIEYQDLKIETANSKIAQAETTFATGYGSETDVLNAKIERCNEQIEKEKQSLNRATACLKIKYLCK